MRCITELGRSLWQLGLLELFISLICFVIGRIEAFKLRSNGCLHSADQILHKVLCVSLRIRLFADEVLFRQLSKVQSFHHEVIKTNAFPVWWSLVSFCCRDVLPAHNLVFESKAKSLNGRVKRYQLIGALSVSLEGQLQVFGIHLERSISRVDLIELNVLRLQAGSRLD